MQQNSYTLGSSCRNVAENVQTRDTGALNTPHETLDITYFPARTQTLRGPQRPPVPTTTHKISNCRIQQNPGCSRLRGSLFGQTRALTIPSLQRGCFWFHFVCVRWCLPKLYACCARFHGGKRVHAQCGQITPDVIHVSVDETADSLAHPTLQAAPTRHTLACSR